MSLQQLTDPPSSNRWVAPAPFQRLVGTSTVPAPGCTRGTRSGRHVELGSPGSLPLEASVGAKTGLCLGVDQNGRVGRRKVATTVYLEAEQDRMLKLLAERTGISAAAYVREGVDRVLEAYADHLPGQYGLFDTAQLELFKGAK